MNVSVVNSQGALVPLDSLAASYTYDGSGNLTNILWTDGTWYWSQTYTYNGSNQLTDQTAITRVLR